MVASPLAYAVCAAIGQAAKRAQRLTPGTPERMRMDARWRSEKVFKEASPSAVQYHSWAVRSNSDRLALRGLYERRTRPAHARAHPPTNAHTRAHMHIKGGVDSETSPVNVMVPHKKKMHAALAVHRLEHVSNVTFGSRFSVSVP
jgi:hypothetical protein